MSRWRALDVIATAAILLAGNTLGAALVLIWTAVTRTPWRRLGFVRPPRGALSIMIALIAGVVLKLLLKAVVMPLLGFGPVNAAYHYLIGNAAALPGMFFTVIVGAGFGEELIWRGFLFDRLRPIFGERRYATVAIVALTSLLFGLAHYFDQGLAGVVQAVMTGMVFGAAYARLKSIWPVMVAHAAFDIAAVLMIYWNLETSVGRFFFVG